MLLVIVILGTVIGLVLGLTDTAHLAQSFRTMDAKYAVIAFALGIGFCFFSAMGVFILIRSQKTKVPGQVAFYITNSEGFFNGITPFSSGSQPFQAYYFIKYGADGEDTTSSLLLNIILYQIIAIIVSTVSLIVYYGVIRTRLDAKIAIVWVGWLINILFLSIMLLTVYVKKFYKFIIGIFKLLAKIKPLRKTMEDLIAKTPKFVEEYQKTVKYMFQRPKIVISVMLVKLISVVMVCSITFFAAKALVGDVVQWADFGYFFVSTVVSFHLMNWVPLPGASGGAEGAMILMLSGVALTAGTAMNATETAAVMLLYRICSYYLVMVYGLLFYLMFTVYNRKQVRAKRKFQKYVLENDEKNHPLRIAYFTDFYQNEDFYESFIGRPNLQVDIYNTKYYGKDYEEKKNATYINMKKIPSLRRFRAYLWSKKISRSNRQYDLIVSDSTLFVGHIAKYYSRNSAIPFVFVAKKRFNTDRYINYLNNKRLASFINTSDLTVFKNEEEKEMILKESRAKTDCYLISNNLKMDEIREVRNKVYQEIGFDVNEEIVED